MHLGGTYVHALTRCAFTDHSVKLQTFNMLQKELQSFINTNKNQTMPYLSHINALMHQAISTCKAAVQISEPLQELGEKENIPPRKSLEHQWRFMKTCKSPGRKRNGNVLRCTVAKVMDLIYTVHWTH